MNAGCRLGWHPSNHYAELNLAKFSRETSNPPRELLFSGVSAATGDYI